MEKTKKKKKLFNDGNTSFFLNLFPPFKTNENIIFPQLFLTFYFCSNI